MQQLVTEDDGVTIASGVTTLALPPPTYGVVPAQWMRADGSTVPQFELEVWSDAALQLTAAELFGAAAHALTLADLKVTSIDATTNQALKVAHGLLTGDGPLRFGSYAILDLNPLTAVLETVVRARAPSTGGDAITLALTAGSAVNAGVLDESAYPAIVFNFKTGVTTVANFEAAIAASQYLRVLTPDGTGGTVLTVVNDDFPATAFAASSQPGGVDPDADLWAIKIDADHFQLATSVTRALSGTPVVDVSSAGGGQLLVTATASSETRRVHWHSFGLLGPAGDGVVDLDVQRARLERFEHSPRTIAYALKATFGAAVAVSARIYPHMDRE